MAENAALVKRFVQMQDKILLFPSRNITGRCSIMERYGENEDPAIGRIRFA